LTQPANHKEQRQRAPEQNQPAAKDRVNLAADNGRDKSKHKR
jgi:hypothetical protein